MDEKLLPVLKTEEDIWRIAEEIVKYIDYLQEEEFKDTKGG